ncbi:MULTISPECIES: polyamine aminopropyltransferase [Chryseobacterium]|uniref:Polyamine aminopropyltransferase n=1 Tax=Chryseobacterium camelliae TaxID=1265445 RepID=A0ABU0TNM9_9FLAO|nr:MULTISPECIES: polyamine aminopropyltransferase [Chryseobacterium]MDT3407503.1 spermidine synthase [Pseudacidovorax intermedius]MDQ1098644.1 spermidine synthase [Chryseobacterium camelliae]MDQ1102568.1 spermidine synthase [Chryseobacterium sp. SORGH_AS_1048]MDR6086002.1 spermidine synthase [Chryseobacterium sp. SORGH_AS_0909]MDR6130369.1 spermidine synthase [Chryseobacterium sp. SORGH_AS_1175]
MDKNRIPLELLLLFSVFVIATCGLIYELVAGALASYLLGDSVKQFSFIIGVYLFSMGVGSYLSKYIKGNLIDKFVEIEILVGIVGGISAVVLFILFNTLSHFEGVLYLFVFCTGCLVGVEIPLLMNILKDRVQFKDLVSNVFAFDYIGALLASILFPLVLIPHLGIVKTPLFFGLINISIAIFLCFYLKRELSSPVSLKFKAIGAFLLLLVLFIFSDRLLSYSEEKLYGENIIFTKSSPYQRIVLTRNNREFRLYLNNNLQFSSTDEYRYHEALVHPALSMARNIRNILVLGGGDGFAVRELLKYRDVRHITLVDLDEQMTSFFKNNETMRRLNQNSLSDPKVAIINKDAYIWVKENKQKWDVIIIDFPDPSNYSLGKLYSQQFYKELEKLTTPDTKIVIQTTSPYFAPKSFWCIEKTVHQVFPFTDAYHTYVPSFGEWGFTLASFKPLNQKLYRKLPNLKFYDYNFHQWTYFTKDMKADDIEVNRLDNQILVRYFDEEWGKVQ